MDATAFYGSGNLMSAKVVKDNKLEGKPLTIKDVVSRILGQDETKEKLILSFEGMDSELALNATNAKIIVEAFGKETEDWKGKKISLTLIRVNFQGQMTDGIQVKTVV